MAAVAAPPGRGGNAPSVWAKRWRFGSCGQWVWRRHPAVAGRENCCDESIEKACERNAQPHRVPLIRPAGTFSPSGGEGMHRTSRADEWFGLQPDDLFHRAAGKPALRRSRSGSANRLLRTVSRCTRGGPEKRGGAEDAELRRGNVDLKLDLTAKTPRTPEFQGARGG